ncbi:ABC transporter substrate-binding protein [Sandarakinorhabdus sp.]|uniref:ABC transporter substrate-binding protein n=1 Tax=Sandarakinorhabdus sp. TaxID=1916663 RepID=UPI003340A281
MSRILLLLLLLLAGCRSPPGGVLTVAVIGEGPLADDLAAEASSATLLRHGPAGELATGLATSWRFLDEGDSVILRLAPQRWPAAAGAPVASGQELVAADIVTSLRRPRDAAARAVLADAGLAARGTVRAPITRVVELLPRPATPFLLDWLAQPALAVRNRRGAAFPGLYVQTRSAGVITLLRRADAPLAIAQAARIIIERPDAAAAARRFASGELQVVLGEGLGGLATARTGATGRALVVEAVHGVIGLAIMPAAVMPGQGALADPHLRRALLLAADGAALANRMALSALQPQNRLWDGLPVPGDARSLPRAERLAQAAELLAAAGYGPDQPLRPLQLTLLAASGAEAGLIADELASRLRPLGIVLKIVRGRHNGSSGGNRGNRVVPRHDLALQELGVRVPDAVAHLSRWRCGRALPCSAAADALLAEARSAGNDLPARAAALTAAEAALMADPAFIPLLRPVRWALVARGVTGFQANTTGHHPLARIRPAGA